METNKTVYIFVDESGDFTFSQKGTQYLVFTALTTFNPFILIDNLNKLKHSLINEGKDIEHFHATEDKQFTRNHVFNVLKNSSEYEINSIIVEKAKTNPSLREPSRLYVKIYEYLLKYILKTHNLNRVIILTDILPLRKKRENVKKGLKEGLKKILDKKTIFYTLHHSSKSHFCLQAVDYCCWAIYKKRGNWYNKKDIRPHQEIKQKIKSEFEIFKSGNDFYY